MDVRWKHHSWFKTCRGNNTMLLQEFSLDASWVYLWRMVHFPVYEPNCGISFKVKMLLSKENMKQTLNYNILSIRLFCLLKIIGDSLEWKNGNCFVRDVLYVMHMCSRHHLDRGGITEQKSTVAHPLKCVKNAKVIKIVGWKKCCQTVWCCLTFSTARGHENRWLTVWTVCESFDSEAMWSRKYPDWPERSLQDIQVLFCFFLIQQWSEC